MDSAWCALKFPGGAPKKNDEKPNRLRFNRLIDRKVNKIQKRRKIKGYDNQK